MTSEPGGEILDKVGGLEAVKRSDREDKPAVEQRRRGDGDDDSSGQAPQDPTPVKDSYSGSRFVGLTLKGHVL